MAGYGLPVFDSDLDAWIPWVSGFTNNPLIVPAASTNERDSITIAAAMHDPVAWLTSPAPVGATSLTVGSGEGTHFDATHHRVLFLDRTEVARVVSRTGDVLTISTDPTTSGRGLQYSYPVASQIERVETVTYAWSNLPTNAPFRPYLLREDYSGTVTQDWQKMVAGHIDDFTVSNAAPAVSVSIVGRTADPLYGHTDETAGDSFYRMEVQTEVLPRNAVYER
jgi:hypothetical protein